MSDLFDSEHRVPTAWCTSRATDPVTSEEAAVRHEPRAASNAGKLLNMIRRINEPLTACELSVASGVERIETSRRLSDLHRRGFIAKGDIKVCAVKQVKMLTWKEIK